MLRMTERSRLKDIVHDLVACRDLNHLKELCSTVCGDAHSGVAALKIDKKQDA